MKTVFETIRTYNQKPFKLKEHIARLMKSAESVKLNSEITEKMITEKVNEMLNSLKHEARIRIILHQESFEVEVIKLEEKPAEYYENGIALVSYNGTRQDAEAKTFENPVCTKSKSYAEKHNAYEAVLLDENQNVTECTYSNIFWVKAGRLYTTDHGILHGITRQTVIELAKDITYETISIQELHKADEVFITQTTSGILPVTKIDGQEIGSGRPGKLAKNLKKDFDDVTWGSL